MKMPIRIKKTQMWFQNEFGPSVTTCVLSIYNLKLDRDCGQHSNSQSTYLCVLLRNQNWLKIGQLTSIARDLYFLSPNLETQWSKISKIFKKWDFWQCLPFSWTTLRGKHCWHPIVVHNGSWAMWICDPTGVRKSI